MIRQTTATVHLSAIAHNCRAIVDMLTRESTAAGRPAPGLLAVVKANAYGHGAVPVARTLEAAGASMLACADIEEGVELRRAGVGLPILVFGALSVSDLDGVIDYDLTPTVSTPSAARRLAALAERRGVTLPCHLKIDSGMNRLGFRHDNLGRTMPAVVGSPHLKIEAVYTHFATADVPESPFLDEQRRRFERALAALGALGVGRCGRHAANSAAMLRDARTWYDFVRPGLLLYGIVPPPLASSLPLRPALSLSSRIVAVKGVRRGEGSGYGLRWTTDEPRTIAIVPAGYADGLDTRLAGRGVVLVRGRRAPVVGAVSMDMLAIDVTDMTVDPGDEVVIIGRQGDDEITAREMAAAIGAIPWEVVCRLGARIERKFED
nr:MAG: alanine racemase [Acidobacteriota bacterium]